MSGAESARPPARTGGRGGARAHGRSEPGRRCAPSVPATGGQLGLTMAPLRACRVPYARLSAPFDGATVPPGNVTGSSNTWETSQRTPHFRRLGRSPGSPQLWSSPIDFFGPSIGLLYRRICQKYDREIICSVGIRRARRTDRPPLARRARVAGTSAGRSGTNRAQSPGSRGVRASGPAGRHIS
jgi:hypothetical protein